MDPMISLGQRNTLVEYMILSGADNRPPMLDKYLVAKDLWERVQLLMQGTSLTKHEREFDWLMIYKMKMEQFQVNTKFLNSLPPE
ncbi:hypothetical protein Tco_1527162 [Tanacetum coccineum]